MKKKIALLLGMVLTVSALAGCTNKTAEDFTADTDAAAEATTEATDADSAATTEMVEGTEAATAAGGLKTGLAIVTSVEKSTDASADAEGVAQADAMIAAVTVDAEGRIVECVIDSAQTVVNFGTDGKITTDMASEFKTKNELGADYGMVAFGGAVAEWDEQAAAFAAYCVGKTADEVVGMELTEDGKAADVDLAASCTVHVGGFQTVVAKAVENATEMGAQAGDKLGLGVVTNIAKSKDAADEDGLAQAYTTVAATTVNADGVITSATIDAVQANVNFDATGKITNDLAAVVFTKNELGDDYGMKKASTIGKEWNEQAAAYAQYAIGKTADEVNGTAVTEGVPSDADLAASVTVHIADFNTVITKAVDSAK